MSEPTRSITDSAEIDRLLQITPELLADVSRLHEQGDDMDAIIWHLYRNGVTKAGVGKALRHSRLFLYQVWKTRLHEHPAFADRRAADERFEEEVAQAWDQIEREENQAAA